MYGPVDGKRAEGKFYASSRAASLVDASGAYHTIKGPTFEEYGVSKVVNVKSVCGWKVAGDGVTDE